MIWQQFINFDGNQAVGPSGGLSGYDWYKKEKHQMVSFDVPLNNQKIKFQQGTTVPRDQEFTYRLGVVANKADRHRRLESTHHLRELHVLRGDCRLQL